MDWDSEIFSKDLNILLEKAGLRSIGGIFERLANAVEKAASNERGDFDPAEALGDLLDDLNDPYNEREIRLPIVGKESSRRRRPYGHGHDPYDAGYNLIPCDTGSLGCTKVLVVICNKDSKFEEYLSKCFEHAVMICPNCENIVFITSTWNSRVYAKYKASVKMIRDKKIQMLFVYLGSRGLRILPE